MTTYPNQKIIHIQKKKVVKDFLQIGNSEWQEASRTLRDSGFKLYLYLASNADGFDLALSQKAFQEATGVKKTAYYDAIKELLNKGYLEEKQGNIFIFFVTPVRKTDTSSQNELLDTIEIPQNELSSSENGQGCPENELGRSENGREIDKHIITDKIDKGSTPLTRSEPVRPQAGEPKGKGIEGTRADAIEKLLEDREVYLLTSKSGEAHEYTFKDFYEEVAGSSENLENIIDAWKRGIERTQENKRKF